jgi:hypothetical protein
MINSRANAAPANSNAFAAAAGHEHTKRPAIFWRRSLFAAIFPVDAEVLNIQSSI